MTSHTTRKLTMCTAFAAYALVSIPAVGQVINEDFKLTASDAAANDKFGKSLAMDNGLLVVASSDDENGQNSGSVYVFDVESGKELFKLIPNDGAENDEFGTSVSISNGIVAVGAEGDDDNGNNSGSAYLFDALTGVQLFKLLPDDGAAGERFGFSISVHNGIVAVGARYDDDNGNNSGSAYLFDTSTGEQLFKLLPNEDTTDSQFSYSIAIYDGIVAAGTLNHGVVYIFNANTGEQIDRLLPPDDDFTVSTSFGRFVTIDENILAVGTGGLSFTPVYLFDASTSLLTNTLLPSDDQEGDSFGSCISIDQGMMAISADRDDVNGVDSGSGYIFDATSGEQITKLLPSDGSAGDVFAFSIAISDGVVVSGAPQEGLGGSESGSVYVFDTVVEPCQADLTNDQMLNFFDVSVFLTYFQIENPAADFVPDGSFNFLDVSAFLTAFANGCP